MAVVSAGATLRELARRLVACREMPALEPYDALAFDAIEAARALADEVERLRETAGTFWKMIEQGGPDGSDLDDAVEDDFRAALAATEAQP